MRLLVAFGLSLAAPLVAQPSAEWKYVSPKFEYWVHDRSVVKESEDGRTVVKVWGGRNIYPPIVAEAVRIESVRELHRIDCKRRQYALRASFYAAPNFQGALVTERQLAEPGTDIAPESLADALRAKYCPWW